jgi:hypothetical protein
MKIAVTSFSNRVPRSRHFQRFFCGLLSAFRLIQPQLQNVDDIARPGKPLRRRKGHEAPILVVIVKAGIKYARYAKSPRARYQSKRRQPSLGTRQRHIVPGRDLPFLRKLSADQQRVNAVRIRGKIQTPCYDMLQRLVALPLALRIDPFRYHAARLPRKRQQHRLVDRRCNSTRTRYGRKLRGHFFVVLDSAGTRPREGNVGRHSQQPLLQGFPETRVHRECDHQRGHARGHSNH